MACMAHVRRKFVDIFSLRDHRSPKRPSAASPFSMPSKRRRGARHRMNALRRDNAMPNPCSTTWKTGSPRN